MGDLAQASGLPTAVAFISDPDNRAQTWREVLRNVYGLTDAEADVAFLVLGGARIKEIARHRGVSLNTVRTHLKHIFDKTNAQSQADLVRVLLSGAPGLLRVPRATPGGDDLPAAAAV